MEVVVYSLTNSIDSKWYLGSTRQKLGRRFSGHKQSAKKGANSPIYKHMREIGVDKWKITKLCSKPYINDIENLKFERDEYDKRKDDNCLNVLKPIRTEEEKKEIGRQNQKKYGKNRTEYKKQWLQNLTPEKRKQRQLKINEQQRLRYRNETEDQREDRNAKFREYRKKNPEKFREWERRKRDRLTSEQREKINSRTRERRQKLSDEVKQLNKIKRREYHIKIKQEKRFYCQCCDRVFLNNSDLNKHYNTIPHIMIFVAC